MIAMFRKAFRDSSKTTLWLSVGLAAYIILMVSIFPTIIEQSENFTELMDSMPEGFLAMMLGEKDVSNFDVTDPATFIQGRYAPWAVLILGAVSIVQAFNAVTNAERDGSLDMLLSLPVTRRAYLMGRFANTALTVFVVLTVSFLAYVLGKTIWAEFDISTGDLALVIYGAFLPLMVFAAFAYLLASVIPSSRHFAGAIAYLFLIGSYLVFSLSQAVDALEITQPFLVYNYYKVGELARDGINAGDWGILLAASLVFLSGAWWAIDRKDLGV